MKFLAVTDLHYTDKPIGSNGRFHYLSAEKLKFTIENFSQDCDFIVCLGDIVDAFDGYKSQEQGLKELSAIWRSSGKPFYALIGNHDTALDKKLFCPLADMPNRYYSVETDEYLCLMLDTCMNSKTEPYPAQEIQWTTCFVDAEQLEWMKETIAKSDKPVVVFTHVLLDFDSDEERNDHVLVNAAEVIEILRESGKVHAIFSGHYHDGQVLRIGGIPCVVFNSVCDEPCVNCAVVEVKDGKITVDGKGTQPNVVF